MKMKITIGDDRQSYTVGDIPCKNETKTQFLYVIEQPAITNNNAEEIITSTVVKDGIVGRSSKYVPEKIPYIDVTRPDGGLVTLFGDRGLVYMNYNAGGRITTDIYNYQQYGLTTVPQKGYVNAVSIYKREIWYEYDEILNQMVAKAEPTYHLVSNQTQSTTVYDFNVGNNRYYEYLFRFVSGGQDDNDLTEGLKEIRVPVKVAWMGWTLTELHEVENVDPKTYGDTKVYNASLRDVWKFKYNISPGDYQQNLSKTKQDTLAMYPKFVHGLMNSISGQVSCLLGRDVLPFDWENRSYAYGKKDGEWGWQWAYNQSAKCGDTSKPLYTEDVDGKTQIKHLNSTYADLFRTSPRNAGGYTEELWPDVNYATRTSNKQLDLLHEFQKFCHSGNPKLLRDALGNRYIVQVHDVSSHAEEMWEKKPITVSFSWTQIGDANDCQIIYEGD